MKIKFTIALGLLLSMGATAAQAAGPGMPGSAEESPYSAGSESYSQSSEDMRRGRMVTSLPDVEVKGMTEGENVGPGKFVIISPNGSITRALCPHTCEQRGLPKSSCRTWQSKIHPGQCYVEDMRNPSDAVPLK